MAFALVALSVGIAACGSGGKSSSGTTASTAATTAGGPGAGKPPVTIGDKNFTEENILGQLYAQALQAKGFRVTLKENVGSTEIIYKALTSGQIDMYPEYTGILLTSIADQTKEPPSAAEAYEQAKAFVEKQGLTLLSYTPFYDSDALATLPAYASRAQPVEHRRPEAAGQVRDPRRPAGIRDALRGSGRPQAGLRRGSDVQADRDRTVLQGA